MHDDICKQAMRELKVAVHLVSGKYDLVMSDCYLKPASGRTLICADGSNSEFIFLFRKMLCTH